MAVVKRKKTSTSSASSSSRSEGGVRKPRALQVDFTGVEGKKGRRVPEGDYLLKITGYGVGGESPGWIRMEHKIVKGPTTGEYSEIFGLKKNQLWRFRNYLEAIGISVSSSVNKIPLEKMIGRSFATTIGDNTYDGKTKSQMNDWFPKDEYEALAAGTVDDDDEDEEEDEESEDEEEEDEDADLTEETDEDEDEEIEIDEDDI